MIELTLEVHDLCVSYGRTTVVRDATLRLESGGITLVVGPNGAGKSSLLNSIAGLVAPSSGRVTLDGTEITGRTPEHVFRQGLALVPEGKRVFSTLTVEENIRLAAASFGRQGSGARVEEALKLFPRLLDRRRQRASFLSGGEQQQLMIARSLVGDPKYVLLDEPSLGLAPQIVEGVLATLQELADRGVAVLLVEQFVQQAVSVSQSVYVLSRGRLQPRMSREQAQDSLKDGSFFEAYSGTGGDRSGSLGASVDQPSTSERK